MAYEKMIIGNITGINNDNRHIKVVLFDGDRMYNTVKLSKLFNYELSANNDLIFDGNYCILTEIACDYANKYNLDYADFKIIYM